MNRRFAAGNGGNLYRTGGGEEQCYAALGRRMVETLVIGVLGAWGILYRN